MSFFLNLLDEVYKENDFTKKFLIAWPNSPNYKEDNLLIYQGNSNKLEPHFNVIYEKDIIYCVKVQGTIYLGKR